MPKILVVYGTTHGQTAKIARCIGDTLQGLGQTADVRDAAALAPAPDPYDAVIVAASVHASGYQRSVRKWVRAHAQTLNAKPGAFVSVCLGVLQQDARVQREVAGIAAKFLDATGWRPAITKIVAGALPYTQYNFFIRWIMKRIVTRAGGDTDTSRDYEYTDWADVQRFAGEFSRRVNG